MGGLPYPSGRWLTYGQPATYKIYLLTMPTSMFRDFGIKKPLDMVAHWALLIDGRCYQLGHTGNKKEPYDYQWKSEPDFVEYRNDQKKPIEYMEVGYMATNYSHEWIDKVGMYFQPHVTQVAASTSTEANLSLLHSKAGME